MSTLTDPTRQILEEIFSKGSLERVVTTFGAHDIGHGEVMVLDSGEHRRIWSSNPLTAVNIYNCVFHLSKGGNSPTGSTRHLSFLAKTFLPRPKSLPSDFLRSHGRVKPWEHEHDVYQVLSGEKDGERVRHLPRAELVEGFDKTLFLTPVGEKTLEEEISGEDYQNDSDKRLKLIADFLPDYAEFRRDALRRAIELFRTDRTHFTRIFGSSDNTTIDKAVNYLRAVRRLRDVEELNREDVATLRDLYSVVAEDYDFTQAEISHADLNLANVLFNGGYSIIDPKLRLRHHLTSIGALLANPGVRLSPNDWERVLDADIRAEAQSQGYVAENGTIGLTEEARGRALKILNLGGVFHKAFRMWAKAVDTKVNFPERYARMLEEVPIRAKNDPEMVVYMRDTTNYLTSKSILGIPQETVDRVGRLGEFFEKKVYPHLEAGKSSV